LRRFSAAKRNGIVISFLQAARAEMTDGIVELQGKLITSIHNKARKRSSLSFRRLMLVHQPLHERQLATSRSRIRTAQRARSTPWAHVH
jgi:hypothetical protein